MYNIKITDFTLFELATFMRLSGYKGPVQATKANKKQLKEVVFPHVMSYLLDYLVNNQHIFAKPFLTKGLDRDSEIVSEKIFSDLGYEDVKKLTLHDFITSSQLVKLIIKKHNESGLHHREDEA